MEQQSEQENQNQNQEQNKKQVKEIIQDYKIDKQVDIKVKEMIEDKDNYKILKKEVNQQIQLVKIQQLSNKDDQHSQNESRFSDSENEREEEKDIVVSINHVQPQIQTSLNEQQEILQKQFKEQKKQLIGNQRIKHYFHLFVNKKSGNQSGIKLLQIPNLKLDFLISKKTLKKKNVIQKQKTNDNQVSQNQQKNQQYQQFDMDVLKNQEQNNNQENQKNQQNSQQMQFDNNDIMNRKQQNNSDNDNNIPNLNTQKNQEKVVNQDLKFFEDKEEYLCEIHIYDLYDQESKKKGFDAVKKQCETELKQQKCKIYCLVAGGDGSVLWLVDEMAKADVDFQKVPITMIPVGTGNDFSRASGWGPEESITHLIENNYKRLQKLMLRWIHAKIEPFDLWDFHFDTYEGGYFQKVYMDKNGKGKKLQMKEPETGKILRRYTRTMSNYFSIGADARVGLGFDKKRTQSRSQNKCVYCIEGVKKFFQKNINIHDTLENLIQIQNFEQGDIQDLQKLDCDHSLVFNTTQKQNLNNQMQNQNLQQKEVSGEIVFKQDQAKPEGSQENYAIGKAENLDQDSFKNEIQNINNDQDKNIKKQDSQHSGGNNNDNINNDQENHNQNGQNKINEPKNQNIINKVLKGNPMSLVCLNIDSYAAGTHGIWKSSVKNHGIINKEDKNTPLKEYERYNEQKSSDKKIEIVAFDNLLSIPLEKVFSGRGQRIAQGKGPFIFKYKQHDRFGKLIQSYFQIDGEYFGIVGAKYITLSLTNKVKGGQINILKQYKKI